MAKFLTTRGNSYEIENIINNAKNRVTLISPYVKIPDTLFQNLKVAADRNEVEIRLVYGKDELKPDVKNQLKQLNNLSLRFLKGLHAKCFFNEECMVITSMNLHDFSEINNKEMGILVTIKDDPDVFEKAREEADRIIDSAEEVKSRESWANKAVKLGRLVGDLLTEDEPKRPKSRSYSYKPRTKHKGYCIRCGKDMTPYNKDYPICHDCWKARVRRGGLCYECGKEWQTTQKKSLCDTCYKKSMR